MRSMQPNIIIWPVCFPLQRLRVFWIHANDYICRERTNVVNTDIQLDLHITYNEYKYQLVLLVGSHLAPRNEACWIDLPCLTRTEQSAASLRLDPSHAAHRILDFSRCAPPIKWSTCKRIKLPFTFAGDRVGSISCFVVRQTLQQQQQLRISGYVYGYPEQC